MTTEDDFQAALDASPDDWQTRLVFADWLEEHARLVCWRCKGAGKNPVQWGKQAGDTIDMICSSCSGSGAGDESDGRRERAEGYRALGVLWRIPQFDTDDGAYWYFANDTDERKSMPDPLHQPRCLIPTDWFKATAPGHDFWTTGVSSRREAEDAAALAFAKLSAARRAELLATVPA